MHTYNKSLLKQYVECTQLIQINSSLSWTIRWMENEHKVIETHEKKTLLFRITAFITKKKQIQLQQTPRLDVEANDRRKNIAAYEE